MGRGHEWMQRLRVQNPLTFHPNSTLHGQSHVATGTARIRLMTSLRPKVPKFSMSSLVAQGQGLATFFPAAGGSGAALSLHVPKPLPPLPPAWYLSPSLLSCKGLPLASVTCSLSPRSPAGFYYLCDF